MTQTHGPVGTNKTILETTITILVLQCCSKQCGSSIVLPKMAILLWKAMGKPLMSLYKRQKAGWVKSPPPSGSFYTPHLAPLTHFTQIQPEDC